MYTRGFYIQILDNDTYQDLVLLTHIAVVKNLVCLHPLAMIVILPIKLFDKDLLALGSGLRHLYIRITPTGT